MNTRRGIQILVAALLLVSGTGLANSFAVQIYSGIGGGGGPVAGQVDGVATMVGQYAEDPETTGGTVVVQVGGGAAADIQAGQDDPAITSQDRRAGKQLTEFDTPPYFR